MLKATVLFIFCFCWSYLLAQQKGIITYKVSGKLDVEDFKPNPEESGSDSALEQFNQRKALLAEVADILTSSRTDTMHAWRQGNSVVTRSTDRQGSYQFYDISSQKFLLIDSSSFEKLGKIDTTVMLFDCKNDPQCRATYKVLLEKGKKNILGYECVNYIIEEDIESSSQGPATRKMSVWVTNKINPVIPTYAVLRLHEKVLANFTPLEIKEHFEKDALSYQLSSATNISK